MVGVAGLDVLLAAVEDGLAGEQLGKDAADGPDVDGLKVCSCTEAGIGTLSKRGAGAAQ